MTLGHSYIGDNPVSNEKNDTIAENKVRNTGGSDTIVGCDTICVHSDTPNAIEIITKLNKAIKNN